MYQDGVTIAIPNWNHEFFLPRSIRSALEAVRHLQANGIKAEVLVVDDGSRDGSLTLLRTLEAIYYGAGMRVHVHQANGGLAASRNTALLQARYRQIVFMDADNEIFGVNLPMFSRAMKDTQAAAVYGSLLIREANHRPAWGICSNEKFQNKIFNDNFIDAFALFDRIQLLDVAGYTTALAAHEDWEMWLHLATSGRKIVFVPLAFGYYYQVENSMIRSMPHDQIVQLRLRSRRMFNQTSFREYCTTNSNHLCYLPEIGYL